MAAARRHTRPAGEDAAEPVGAGWSGTRPTLSPGSEGHRYRDLPDGCVTEAREADDRAELDAAGVFGH